MTRLATIVVTLAALCLPSGAFLGTSLSTQHKTAAARRKPVAFASQSPTHVETSENRQRRQVISDILSCLAITVPSPNIVLADSSSLDPLLEQVKQARSQLEAVPALIEKEQWDSVRAILITPPLSDCWAKTGKPLLQKYAEAVGDAGFDELEALEAREEASTHLRFLDMAVYNNVFNPITTEGKTGATKELIRSYYEDPILEYKASRAALEALVQVGTGS